MSASQDYFARLAQEDDFADDRARAIIHERGWELDESVPGWVRATKGEQMIGGNTVQDVLDWIKRRGRHNA
jgi:hypothetical protein